MIKLGPAGSSGLGSIEGIKKVKELGLDAMEIEFTYGVNMSNEKAKEVGNLAKDLNIALSVHAPYYINLASEENIKVRDSKRRILDAAERAHHMGAKYVVFHGGFYQKRTKNETYRLIKKEVKDLVKLIKKNKWKVLLALETTGKKTQFGDLEELLKLKKETGCSICVDFSHLLAREGVIDHAKVLNRLKGLDHIHSHLSGIEYSEKGERRHVITEKKDILPILKELVKRKVDITIINESPDPIGDTLKTKKILSSLKRN